MSVYVDKIVDYTGITKLRWKKWCHMWADSVPELLEFASKLGLKREWFQNKPNFPHFDLIPTKRKLAVKLGAKEITLREWYANKSCSS